MFRPSPALWLGPGYSLASRRIRLTTQTAGADVLLTKLTDAEANASSGDIRMVMRAICYAFWEAWAAQQERNLPKRMILEKTVEVLPVQTTLRETYRFQFDVESNGVAPEWRRPVNVSALEISPGTIRFSWETPADGEPDAYELEYENNDGNRLATADLPSPTSVSISGFDNSVDVAGFSQFALYNYRMRAITDGVASGWVLNDPLPSLFPGILTYSTGLAALAGDGEVTLSWDWPPTNLPNIPFVNVYVTIYISTVDDPDTSVVAGSAADGPLTITDLVNGTPYFFWLQSTLHDNVGQTYFSTRSPSVTATPTP